MSAFVGRLRDTMLFRWTSAAIGTGLVVIGLWKILFAREASTMTLIASGLVSVEWAAAALPALCTWEIALGLSCLVPVARNVAAPVLLSTGASFVALHIAAPDRWDCGGIPVLSGDTQRYVAPCLATLMLVVGAAEAFGGVKVRPGWEQPVSIAGVLVLLVGGYLTFSMLTRTTAPGDAGIRSAVRSTVDGGIEMVDVELSCREGADVLIERIVPSCDCVSLLGNPPSEESHTITSEKPYHVRLAITDKSRSPKLYVMIRMAGRRGMEAISLTSVTSLEVR